MAYRFVVIQAVAVLIACLLWLLSSLGASWSALLGGVAVVLPSAFFATWLFRTTSARAAQRIVRAFFVGELIKMITSAVLAVVFVMLFHVAMVPFWVGFMVALVGFWIAPAFVKLDISKGGKT